MNRLLRGLRNRDSCPLERTTGGGGEGEGVRVEVALVVEVVRRGEIHLKSSVGNLIDGVHTDSGDDKILCTLVYHTLYHKSTDLTLT